MSENLTAPVLTGYDNAAEDDGFVTVVPDVSAAKVPPLFPGTSITVVNNVSCDIHHAVDTFRAAMRLPAASTPTLLTEERTKLRLDLIEEEWEELRTAYQQNDIVEVADALGDIVYLCFGAAIEMGINLNEVLQEIQRGNMSKLLEDGTPLINRCWVDRGDGKCDDDCHSGHWVNPKQPLGKVLKGPNYLPPDIAAVLRQQGWTGAA